MNPRAYEILTTIYEGAAINENTLVTNGIVSGTIVWGEDDIIGYIEVDGLKYLATINWKLLEGWYVV